MSNKSILEIPSLVQDLYSIVDRLEELFPGRRFTPDGHLVGSIGEVLAAAAYDLELLPPSTECHDALSGDGRNVQIKATQVRSVSLSSESEYLLVIQIQPDGSFADRPANLSLEATGDAVAGQGPPPLAGLKARDRLKTLTPLTS